MIDIKKIFEDSFNLLNKQRKLAIPLLIATAIPLALIFLFIQSSGLGPLLRELAAAEGEFQEQKIDYLIDRENLKDENYVLELFGYLGRDSANSPYNDQFSDYLTGKGFDYSRFIPLLNARNGIMLGIFILLGTAGVIYFSAMSYIVISPATAKNKAMSAAEATNRLVFRFVGTGILLSIIFIAPIIMVILAAYLSPMLAAVILIPFIILYIAYLIFVGTKLLFALPIMFIEDRGAFASLKQSFVSTKGRFKQAFFIGFVIFGIGMFINSFVARPLYDIFYNVIFEPNFLKISANSVFLLLFLALESIVITFQRIFLFSSYINYTSNFKNLKGGK